MIHWIEEAEKAAATDREKLDVAQLREGYAAFFGKLDEISRAKTPLTERKQKIKQLIDDVLEIKLLTPAQVYLNTNEEDIENSNDQEPPSGQRRGARVVAVGDLRTPFGPGGRLRDRSGL